MATAAGSTIGALRVVIGADTTGLNRGLKEAQSGMDGVGHSAAAAAKRVAVVGAAFAAAAGAISYLVRGEADLIASQAKLARSIDGTITGLRTLNMAAADNGIEGMNDALNRMNRRLGAAAMGTGPAIAAVEALGLNLKEINEMDVDAKLALIADRIKESGMSSQEAARHLQNLGFQQAEATTFFMQGGDAIRAAREEVERYGLAVDEASAAKLEDITTQWTRISTALAGVKTQLTLALLPALESIGNLVESAAQALAGLTPYISRIVVAFGHVAEAVGVAGLALAAFYAPAVLAGIAKFTVAVGVGAVGAVKALTAAMLANPIGAIAVALVAAGYAAYKFRDQISEAIGVDVVDIAKTAANTVINSFVAAYEDIKFVWNNFGNMMGGAVVGGINVAIRAINRLIEGALSGINALIDAVNKIPGVDIGKIGDSAKIELLNNEYSARLVDAVKERNAKIAAIMSTDRFAGFGETPPTGRVGGSDGGGGFDFGGAGFEGGGSGGGGGGGSGGSLVDTYKDQLQQRLDALRQFIATEEELEIANHEKRLEDLRVLWEEGIIPTEEEMMELREGLEEEHWDRITAIRERAEQDHIRNVQRAAQMENQLRQGVTQNAIGLLDQLAGKSKAAALASIVLNKAVAMARVAQTTAEAAMLAYASQLVPGDPSSPARAAAAAAKAKTLGAIQMGLIAATGIAQAAGAMSSGSSLSGGASGSIGGMSSAPSSAVPDTMDAQRSYTSVTINLQGESYSRQQVRDLIEQINEATADGAVLRLG